MTLIWAESDDVVVVLESGLDVSSDELYVWAEALVEQGSLSGETEDRSMEQVLIDRVAEIDASDSDQFLDNVENAILYTTTSESADVCVEVFVADSPEAEPTRHCQAIAEGGDVPFRAQKIYQRSDLVDNDYDSALLVIAPTTVDEVRFFGDFPTTTGLEDAGAGAQEFRYIFDIGYGYGEDEAVNARDTEGERIDRTRIVGIPEFDSPGVEPGRADPAAESEPDEAFTYEQDFVNDPTDDFAPYELGDLEGAQERFVSYQYMMLPASDTSRLFFVDSSQGTACVLAVDVARYPTCVPLRSSLPLVAGIVEGPDDLSANERSVLIVADSNIETVDLDCTKCPEEIEEIGDKRIYFAASDETEIFVTGTLSDGRVARTIASSYFGPWGQFGGTPRRIVKSLGHVLTHQLEVENDGDDLCFLRNDGAQHCFPVAEFQGNDMVLKVETDTAGREYLYGSTPFGVYELHIRYDNDTTVVQVDTVYGRNTPFSDFFMSEGLAQGYESVVVTAYDYQGNILAEETLDL